MRGAAHHRYSASLSLRIHSRRRQWLQLCPARSNCPVRYFLLATTSTRSILAAIRAFSRCNVKVFLRCVYKETHFVLHTYTFAMRHKLSNVLSSFYVSIHAFANGVIKIMPQFSSERRVPSSRPQRPCCPLC